MEHDIGAAASSTVYEYTVAQKKTPATIFKRATFIALYVLVAAALIHVGVLLDLVLLFLELGALVLWALILLTWRLTKIEYEYSIFDGTLAVYRILGGRTRRRLCRVTIRRLTAVYPCDDEYAARIESFGANRTVFAASHRDAENLYAALWIDEKDRKHVLFFEPEERALKLLRRHNITAVTLRK